MFKTGEPAKKKPKPRSRKQSNPTTYDSYRESQAEINRKRSEAGRDISPMPAVENPERRGACRLSLRLFCETYLSGWFPLEWSPDHLKAIEKLEGCVLRGDRYCFAMPRGGGKTSLCRAAAMWAVFYGHRFYVMLVAAADDLAQGQLLDKIKDQIETNDLFLEDFPEVCYPVRRLERITHRCRGQTLDGESTLIKWGENEIVIATVPGSVASGSVIRSAGSKLRGPSATRADRTIIRPDLALIDDPSTDESATSVMQNGTRERLINGTVLGMAGPKRKIAAMMACTVIAPGDLAERFLDRDRSPTWQGDKSKMIYTFPVNEKLWEEYRRIRKEALVDGRGYAESNQFYIDNRESMDEGCVVGWPQRFEDTDVSAVQTAMNKWIDSPRIFAAEYQNEPIADGSESQIIEIDADALCKKLNNVAKWEVPRECSRLTAGIDVQGGIIFFLVMSWNEKFGGSVVSYGTFPEQSRDHFTAADARPSLAEVFPGMVEDAQIYQGVFALANRLAEKAFVQQETGAVLRIERILIDSGWKPDIVYKACRESPYASIMTPSKGYGITAAKVPVAEWPKRSGEREGWNWRMSAPERGRGRLVKIDTYLWKSFVAERLLAPKMTPGCIDLFGSQPYIHQLFADHCTAEFRVRTTGRGRVLDEWQNRPGRNENHWWDCLILASVAASVQGLKWSLTGGQPQPAKPKRKLNIEDLYQRAGA